MATVQKILGQASLSANTNTVLYTVPALTETEAILNICNTTNYPTRVNVAITVSGGTLGAKDYLIFEKQIESNDYLKLSDLRLDAGAFVTVRSNRTGVSFNLMGGETA